MRLLELNWTSYDNQSNRFNLQRVEAADNIKGLHFLPTLPPGNRSLWENGLKIKARL